MFSISPKFHNHLFYINFALIILFDLLIVMENAKCDRSRDLDIWFTQDALDADNLSAAHLVAEYAVSMATAYKNVHLWLDVSTAQRCLSGPRFKYSFQDAQENFCKEILNGDINGFMGNSEEHSLREDVVEDSLLCQQYDAALLLHVILNVVTKAFTNSNQIKVNVLIGEGGITKQVIWEPLVPNTFLFFDFGHDRMNLPETVVEVQEILEGIYDIDMCYKVEKEEHRYGKRSLLLKYNSRIDSDRRERRSRFRCYVKKQIDRSHLFSKDRSHHQVHHHLKTAVREIENRDSVLHVIVCAPMTNCSKMLHCITDKSRITKVVGQLLTLGKEDNLVGAQWNEYLDLEASTSFFKELNDFGHSCQIFFTPTQFFKKSKNMEFAEQLVLKELNNTINAAALSRSGNIKNNCLGFQRLWNLAKSAQLTRNPDYTKVIGEPIFDPIAICYLLNKSLFGKVLKCKVVIKEGIPTPVIDPEGKFCIPNVYHSDSVCPEILSTVLGVYDLTVTCERGTRRLFRCLVLAFLMIMMIMIYFCLSSLFTSPNLPIKEREL